MNNSAWHVAREKAGLPKLRVHDLRHTYGARLRVAGVEKEARASLLGHATQSMPEHYAAADIGRLFNLSNDSLDSKSTCMVISVLNR